MRKLFFCFLGNGAMGTGPASQKNHGASKALEYLNTKEYWDKGPVPVSRWRKGNVWDGELFYEEVKGNYDE